jgi:hypothetical protein
MKYLVTLALIFLFTGTPPAEEKTELCDDGICVVQFNASFNAANEVTWLGDLKDCTTATVDIMENPNLPTDYKIVVVPTILILEDGAEVARFQANIMMTMETTQDEVQESIDEIIMSKF